MSLNQLPYDRALPLVRANLCFDETPKTTALIRELREARRRGYLRPRELEAICRWKSPRAIKLIRSNTAHAVRSVTRAVLATRSERQKLETLTQLSGVSRPMASAVLMLLDPKRYGVTDIRVWELLHTLGTVTKNPRGKGFGFNNWYQYLDDHSLLRQGLWLHGARRRAHALLRPQEVSGWTTLPRASTLALKQQPSEAAHVNIPLRRTIARHRIAWFKLRGA